MNYVPRTIVGINGRGYLHSGGQFLVELLFVPGGQLGEEGDGRLALALLLVLVAALGVEALQQDTNILI